ncbi:hypothetical protein [Methanoregula sp.]|uniref:hypothetical protein n=1 Tax=Methanoregula sp. TaxID=2052170 RepID=UPI002374260C|nr:hypothetical protein [Methanoregula sp.]MDD1687551.1 hypothetical protein [Methanoregula sp.]
MISDLVLAALASCDGILFDAGNVCPRCGGDLSGYDVKEKQFAIIRDGEQLKTIHVRVKRFRCRHCRQICLADQPFYPDIRIGAPVVDLCVTLGETMHSPRVSSCLEEMGIIVDRWSVRNYVQRNIPPVPSVDMFGIRVPRSIVSLSSLSMGTGGSRRFEALEVLEACNYPSGKEIPAMPIHDPSTSLNLSPD